VLTRFIDTTKLAWQDLKGTNIKLLIMKQLACRDVGFDCNQIFRGETEDEIMTSASEHAIKQHNIKPEDMTPEFKEKVRRLIAGSL
jgi:predicted small metal-binding protein